DIERNELALFVAQARAYRDNLTLLRLLFGSVRNDDAAGGFFVLVDATDHDPVLQRPEVHCRPPLETDGNGKSCDCYHSQAASASVATQVNTGVPDAFQALDKPPA